MAEVSGVTNQTNPVVNPMQTKSSSMLDKDDFLMLFLESLKNQDPMNPMDNAEMMSQLNQLAQMEAITNLTVTVNNMKETLTTNKLIDAAALLDKTIVATDNEGKKVVGEPSAYRLNDGVVEYLIDNKIINIGQILEIGKSSKPNPEIPIENNQEKPQE